MCWFFHVHFSAFLSCDAPFKYIYLIWLKHTLFWPIQRVQNEPGVFEGDRVKNSFTWTIVLLSYLLFWLNYYQVNKLLGKDFLENVLIDFDESLVSSHYTDSFCYLFVLLIHNVQGLASIIAFNRCFHVSFYWIRIENTDASNT